jgi:DNA-directed RNA polymerase specialized sigma24 family protein
VHEIVRTARPDGSCPYLQARQREALVLGFYTEISEVQIADAMGISRRAVKGHTSPETAALRSILEPDE